MAHAHCMVRNKGYKHTLRIPNTYCLSTATIVKLHVHCPPCYHNHDIFDPLHPIMELIRINSGTALVKGENDHVLKSYTVTSLRSVRAIDYYIKSTDPGHLHMPNSTVLQYTHCEAMHTRLINGAEIENEFRLTITCILIFCCYNSNKHWHTILLKSQYYKTPAATHFRPHREHTVVQTFV